MSDLDVPATPESNINEQYASNISFEGIDINYRLLDIINNLLIDRSSSDDMIRLMIQAVQIGKESEPADMAQELINDSINYLADHIREDYEEGTPRPNSDNFSAELVTILLANRIRDILPNNLMETFTRYFERAIAGARIIVDIPTIPTNNKKES